MVHLLAPAPPPPPPPPPPLLRLDYSTQAAPRLSPLRQSASLTRRTSWFGPASSFPAFPPCVLLLSLPGVNLRRRKKKTQPSLSSASNLPSLFSSPGTIGFRAVPVNSPPSPARVEQQQLGNIWPPQSARLPVPPPARLGSLLWKLVESLPSFVSEGGGRKTRRTGRRKRGETLLSVSAASGKESD